MFLEIRNRVCAPEEERKREAQSCRARTADRVLQTLGHSHRSALRSPAASEACLLCRRWGSDAK